MLDLGTDQTHVPIPDPARTAKQRTSQFNGKVSFGIFKLASAGAQAYC